MAKRCSVCNKSFPDELNYCPQCGAWAEAAPPQRPKTSPERPSSGDILLDPMQPDPPSGVGLGQSSAANGDDIIEIDWEEIETPDAPAAATPPKGPPPIGTPSPSQSPPIMAGWQAVPPKKSTDPNADAPPPSVPKSSSADFELPPNDTIRPRSEEDINIDALLGDESGSEVRLAPRSGEAPVWDDEDIQSGTLAADAVHSEADRLEEPSAVNLAALAGAQKGDSAEYIGAAESIRKSSPVIITPRRSSSGWIGGGLIGAGLATAACVGLWYGGVLDGFRGDKPVEQRAAETLPMPADSDAKSTIDRLAAEKNALQAEKQQVDDRLASVQKMLTDSKYLNDEQQNVEAGLTNLLKDFTTAKEAKPDDTAAQMALDKLKKENEALANDKKKSESQNAAIVKILTDAKYVTEAQANAETGLANVMKDLAAAKQAKPDDAAAQMALDKLKKENEALANDKKKSESQVTAIESLLKESKYVSEQQPDVVKALDSLIKEQKKSGDAPAALSAVADALRAAKYVSDDQTSVAKGIEKLLADKQAAEKGLSDATAMLKNVDAGGKDAAAKIKEAQDRAKEASDRVSAIQKALDDTTAKLRTADEKVQDTSGKLKAANDTVQDVARALVNAKIVAPDARGPALVRGVEHLASAATAAPKNGGARNGGISRPPESATPSDPLGAERYYVRGLSNFWAGRYWTAESDFFDAVRTAGSSNPDARYYYFLGLTQLAQGKPDEARAMFKMAGSLEEQRRPSSAVVSRALERVQGRQRRVVEDYRP